MTFPRFALPLFIGVLASTAVPSAAQPEFKAGDLQVRLVRGADLASLRGPGGRDYLDADHSSSLLNVVLASGEHAAPTAMSWNQSARTLTLRYGARGPRVRVKVVERPTHAVFEVVGVEPADSVQAVAWGPIATTISATVGEIVGVVRDESFAIGMQVLNLKTRGGVVTDEGSDPSRGSLALARPWGGSSLQAFTLDRSRPRRVAAWNGQYPDMPVPPMPGETVVGSKIALFGCAPAGALDRIGAIEQAEGVPHPTFDGEWIKQWRNQGRSYLIAAFTEDTVDELLAYTRRADLMTLYHPEPFASWGHYGLDQKMFPNGDEGMKRAVAKGTALGIRIGVHTLTNFINTNDAYVSPVPDARLARAGSSPLAADVDERATEIRVSSPDYFTNEKANWLHTVVIDQELIRYRAVSTAAPWTLLGCERGAFGTRWSAHRQGAPVGKLIDHPYKVFFPTLELQDEIATNLARWFNKTGVGQLDFDGREGCLASGEGDYAQDRFAEVFYRNLDHSVVNGTSTSSPYYWHINSYCNWGEPWYGGFRESMQEYRIQNQSLFDRNYVPNMLGWYRLTATTSVAEMEWMLARAAGFKAGFAMSTTLQELRANTDTGRLLDTIREWETARRAGAFSADQRERLKNSRLEFHLEPAGGGAWRLFPFHDSAAFRHESGTRQPGEPTGATWEFENRDAAQPLQFRLVAAPGAGSVSRIRFEIDHAVEIGFEVELKGGESLVFDGTGPARVYDVKGRQAGIALPSRPAPSLEPGRHGVAFDCAFSPMPAPAVEVTFRTRGAAEPVGR
jgi:hypothetical protein